MAEYKRRLAERIRHERDKRSLSRDSLALRSGISAKTIKRIEEEKVDNPRPVTIRRLAEALEVEPDQLRPPEELEQEQLARIERGLNLLLDHFDLVDVEELEQLAGENGQGGELPDERKHEPPDEDAEEGSD